jgi:hypothetical protein
MPTPELPTRRKRRNQKQVKPATAPAEENLGLPRVFTRIATPASKAKKKTAATLEARLCAR